MKRIHYSPKELTGIQKKIFVSIEKEDLCYLDVIMTQLKSESIPLSEIAILNEAIYTYKQKVVKFFVNSRLDIKTADENNCTPIVVAAYTNNLETLELLLTKNTDPDSKMPSGESLLEYAFNNCYVGIFLLLFNYGADASNIMPENGEEVNDQAKDKLINFVVSYYDYLESKENAEIDEIGDSIDYSDSE